MQDIYCPYCESGQEINHDDGYGFDEDQFHQQECTNCDKTFCFITSISYSYNAYKAECLNGGEHKYEPTNTYPLIATKMACIHCDDRRHPTAEEMAEIMKAGE